MASETVTLGGAREKVRLCTTHLLCIDDLYVTIDKNSFPFRQSCVFASLHKGDRRPSFC